MESSHREGQRLQPEAPLESDSRGSWPRLGHAQLASLGPASSLKNGTHVLGEWALIVGAVAFSEWFASPWAVVAAIPLIAARQHALAALAHEAAHGRLFPGRWNLHLAEAFVAWPLLLSTRAYRRVHMAHHRFLSTPKDPDWVRNRPDLWEERRGFGAVARGMHLAGLRVEQLDLAQMFVGTAQPSSKGATGGAIHAIVRAVYYLVAALIITFLGGWSILGTYWLLPLFTWFLLLMRARGIAEHWAVEDSGPLTQTRTLLLSPPFRFFFLPMNMGYHLEHHLYPSVPFTGLPRLHRELMADPDYAKRAHVTRGLGQLLRELAGVR